MTLTLVIAAHLDDEALSCGGLIQARVAAGHDVRVLFMFGRVYDYGRVTVQDSLGEEQRDCEAAKAILGYQEARYFNRQEGEPYSHALYPLLEIIEGALQSIAPTEVVIHGSTDRNQDHRFLADLCRIALRPANLGKVERILEMIPHDGGGPVSAPTYYVPLSEDQMARKLRAVEAYRKEARRSPHPRSPEMLLAHHSIMGSACGAEYAEAYRLVMQREGTHASSDTRRRGLHRDQPDAASAQDGTLD